ncbi:hypothetical protein BKM67_02895 [Streptococcus suis]|uniref:hypothetical protein n=1 Tax=Streptococcus suis TaxID=1307 RepID=UPI000DC754AC|nr:hypothetical protein [Streptococcus suis]AWX97026.1 hypothetical protein BKM67_02895 [Streptococcus suis]
MTYIEAANTTLEEFYIYNTAYAIQQEDKRHLAAIQAWFNQSVKATKGKGKQARSAYRKFEDFYNHKEEFDKLFESVQPVKKTLSLADKNRLLNQAMRGGG